MAWIESHTVLARHRKVAELAELLEIPRAQALGHLHALWHTALEQQENGDLSKWPEKFIAESALWEKRSDDFMKAMRETGFLDGCLLHDWIDYAGAYLTRKYKESNRQKLVDIWRVYGRKYGGSKKEVKQLPLGEPKRKPTRPYQTLPDLTLPTKEETPPLPPKGGFDLVWAKFPNRTGRKAAERHFKTSVKTMTDFLDIQRAMSNYLKSDRVKNGYLQNGSTWFNNWRDWINYTEGHNAPHDSAGISEYAAIARANREAQRVREKEPSGGTVSSGV